MHHPGSLGTLAVNVKNCATLTAKILPVLRSPELACLGPLIIMSSLPSSEKALLSVQQCTPLSKSAFLGSLAFVERLVQLEGARQGSAVTVGTGIEFWAFGFIFGFIWCDLTTSQASPGLITNILDRCPWLNSKRHSGDCKLKSPFRWCLSSAIPIVSMHEMGSKLTHSDACGTQPVHNPSDKTENCAAHGP
jgi:hypothetical protein